MSPTGEEDQYETHNSAYDHVKGSGRERDQRRITRDKGSSSRSKPIRNAYSSANDGHLKVQDDFTAVDSATSSSSFSDLNKMAKIKEKTAEICHLKPNYEEGLTEKALEYFKAKRRIWYQELRNIEASDFTFSEATKRFYYYDKRVMALESTKIARMNYIASDHFEVAAAQDDSPAGQRKAARHMAKGQAWLNRAGEVFSYDESDHIEDQYQQSYVTYHEAL